MTGVQTCALPICKSFVAGADSTVKTAQSAAFAEDVAEAMKRLSPLMRFLCDALGVPF